MKLEQLNSDRTRTARRLKRYLVVAAIALSWLVVDYSLLRFSRTGGNLAGGLVSYVPEPLLLLRYSHNDSGEQIEILDEGKWLSPAFEIAELEYQIFVYKNVYKPIWAPTKLIFSRATFRLSSDRKLPDNLLQLTLNAAAEHRTISAAYVQDTLGTSNQKTLPIHTGVARNYLAALMFGALLAMLLLVVNNAILLLKLTRATRSFSCVCGYSLEGLASNTCPECGRTLDTHTTRSSSTMDT